VGGLIGFGAGVVAMSQTPLPAMLGQLTPQAQAQAQVQAAAVAAVPTTGAEPIADLVDRVGPAVVNIDTLSKRPNPMRQMPFFMMDMDSSRMPDIEQKGVGSGFIISANGRILTNDHVVRGATSLTVTLPDGRKFPGKVVGHDPGQDIALVKIEAKNLPTLRMADSGHVRVGQRVIAIGSPLGLEHTVTSGIVSALHRGIEINDRVDFIQTDAPINPGNSGGPLLNMAGDVVGMNTAVANGAQGIGFAIPAETLAVADKDLETKGHVARAWLGVQLTDGVPGRGPAIVGGVVAGSPADKIGLQPGDIIEQINGQKVSDSRSVVRTIGKFKVGERLKLDVRRQGQALNIALNLAEMPENPS
jgi:S1-C subfamily serine protease